MAKIHWLAYIAVGLLISIFSWRANYEKLRFFFYAGFVFVFIGIVKLIFNLIKKRAKETQHKVQLHQSIRYCHNCGAALRHRAKFCTRCGAKV